MTEGEKGTVIHFNSLFTSEEAEKAARRVEDAIADHQKELCRLRDFISDNSVLIQHVQKLPEELSHDIMVPFGGAAFFPGRLIHTNEFLVLLGEGYYVERTAKQTLEILQRRGKSLEAHLESLNRIMKDLEVEAKFFDSTAAEVAEGLVEIREDYIEETQSKEPESVSNSRFMNPSNAHNSGVHNEEDVDAKLMARLDELEKEEEEAASDLDDEEDDQKASSSDADEVDDDENGSFLRVDKDEDDEDDEDVDEASFSKAVEDEDEDDEEENDEDEYKNDNTKNTSQTNVEVLAPKVIGPRTSVPTSMQHNALGLLQHPAYQSSVSSSKMQVAAEGSLESIVEQPQVTQHPLLPPETIEDFQKPPPSYIQNSSENIPSQSSKTGSNERKAFTGTVIEHNYGLSPTKPSNNSTSGQPSRPISRFKTRKSDR